MKKAFLVARQEYLSTIRTKAFWLGLLSFPLIIALAVTVPTLLLGAQDARSYAVVDESGFLLREVDALIYKTDLETLLSSAAAWKREGGGREFDRLPDPVRELTHAWLELGEEERPALAETLARLSVDPQAELPAALNASQRALQLVGSDARQSLHAWWKAVSSDELEELSLELSHARFTRVGAGEETLAELNGKVNAGRLFAYIAIGPDPVGDSGGCKYVSNNLTDRDLLQWFSAKANAVIRQHRIRRENIDPAVASWIEKPLTFAARKVGSRGGDEEVAKADTARQWAPVGFTYLLWIAIFTSAQMLLTSTIEEKSARIIEVLLSSVSPFQLMAGKIAGVAAAGLTVVASWAFYILIAVAVVPTLIGSGAAIGMLAEIVADPFLLLAFILYFVLGYLFYAAFLAGVGSVCNNLKDAQNLMLPVMIPMMVAIFAMVPIGRDPNGLLARVMSFIPPFTPFVMMNRSAGPPALWEYFATALVMIGAIYVAVHAAAKVFRIGILMTGKPPSIRQMARWLTMDAGAVPPQDDAQSAIS